MDVAGNAVALAVETLARELGCDPARIAVGDVTPVTWPNSALGCPQPGMMYLQVITPGYRVRLTCDGREYTMHTDQGRRAVRCPDREEDAGSTRL